MHRVLNTHLLVEASVEHSLPGLSLFYDPPTSPCLFLCCRCLVVSVSLVRPAGPRSDFGAFSEYRRVARVYV